MLRKEWINSLGRISLGLSILVTAASHAYGLNLGPETIIQADGADITVPGYSVPSFEDWNSDGRNDLVIGEGGATIGKVRVYLNTGTPSNPEFAGYSYAQSNNSDLTCSASGCMGCFPRLLYTDGDPRKALMVGQADGTIKIYQSVGSASNPTFDGGSYFLVGPTGSKSIIDVGSRVTPSCVDWNNDGKEDLIVGAYDGKIRIYLNQSIGIYPDFQTVQVVQNGGTDLIVPSGRSSPAVIDINGDGKKDILAGNTNGQLLLYPNIGMDSAPAFSGYEFVQSMGINIDLPDYPRSRPFVCDFNDDGNLDVLIGAGDGKVHLYHGLPEPASLMLCVAGVIWLKRKQR